MALDRRRRAVPRVRARADRVDHPLVIRLLTEPSDRRSSTSALELARAKRMDRAPRVCDCIGLADVTCEVRERSGDAVRTLDHLELGGERYDRDRLLPFFDSLGRGDPRGGLGLAPGSTPTRRMTPCSGHGSVRNPLSASCGMRLVPALERHARGACRVARTTVAPALWTTVLARRPARQPHQAAHALRQLTDALVEDSRCRAETLLPVVAALAVRSIRGHRT